MHDYLGMRIDYGTKGKVRITMPKHIKSILETSAEDMYVIDNTPSDNNMFTVREDGDRLTGTHDDLFRTLVAKICSSAVGQGLNSRQHWISSPRESAILTGMTTRSLNV